MTDQANSQDRTRAALVIIATVGTIVFGVLAAAGYVNEVRPAVLWDKYLGTLKLAAYAFSIWNLVWFGLAAFGVYQFLPANLVRFRPVRSIYIVSCVLNCASVYLWHLGLIGIGFVLVLGLVGTLVLIFLKLNGCRTFGETWLMQAPLGLYLGWVAALAIINFAALPAYLGMNMSPATANIFALVLMLVAALVAIAVRVRLGNFFFPLSIAWALTAIAVRQSGNTAIVVFAALGVVVCLVTTGSFVVNLRDSTSE